MAVAFANYAAKPDVANEVYLDPSIGTLIFQHAIWGIGPNGDIIGSTTNLNSYPCSEEDLGLTT